MRDHYWKGLGEALPRLVAEAELDVGRAVRDHGEQVLALVAANSGPLGEPNVRDPEFRIGAVSGALGPHVRELSELVNVLREIEDLWRSIDEDSEDSDGDRWKGLSHGLAELRPLPPEGALDELADLPRAAREAAADPMSTWPLFATGETEAEVVGQALRELSARAAIPRDALPQTPVLPDRPVMIACDAAHAVGIVHDWLASREAWGRALGRLAPWLAR